MRAGAVPTSSCMRKITEIAGHYCHCNNKKRKLCFIRMCLYNEANLSSTMTSLSVFKAASRFWVFSKRLSTVTLCCFFCCSISLSKTCNRSIFLVSLEEHSIQPLSTQTMHNTYINTHIRMQGLTDSLTYPLKVVFLLRSSPASFVVHSAPLVGMWLELLELHCPLSATNKESVLFLGICGWTCVDTWRLSLKKYRLCACSPEQSPSLSVWEVPRFGLSARSSSEDSPVSPEAPCTYAAPKTQTLLTA